MYIQATTAALPLISQLSSTLPMVYMATTGIITAVGFPTLGLMIAPIYAESSEGIAEASLLAARPNAVRVIGINA